MPTIRFTYALVGQFESQVTEAELLELQALSSEDRQTQFRELTPWSTLVDHLDLDGGSIDLPKFETVMPQ